MRPHSRIEPLELRVPAARCELKISWWPQQAREQERVRLSLAVLGDLGESHLA
jgi:hypothetical protein